MCGFGVVVEADRVQRLLGDACGAVVDGGDGGLSDESGEAADASGGALVEVGGVAGEGTGPVLFKVEGVFEVGDGVGEGVCVAEAGGEWPALDE